MYDDNDGQISLTGRKKENNSFERGITENISPLLHDVKSLLNWFQRPWFDLASTSTRAVYMLLGV